MFDSHCHLYASDSLNAIAEQKARNQQPTALQIKKLCVLGTKPSDWELVERALSEVQGTDISITPGFGVHPWFVSEVTDVSKTTEQLKGLLLKYPKAIIGEVGVDALKPEYEKQWEIFKAQFHLATEYKRPISIHCVHAITELFEFLIKQTAFPPAISFHSFGSSPELAQSLLKKITKSKLYFGFSFFVNGRSINKTLNIIKAIPQESILIESDLESTTDKLPTLKKLPPFLRIQKDGEDSVHYSLEQMIQIVSKALEVDIANAVEITTHNAETFVSSDQ